MSSALTGNKIKDSYQALLKIGTNGSLDPTTAIAISDGLGNDTPLQLAADKLLTNYLGFDIGLKLDFQNYISYLGDFNNSYNGASFVADYNNGYIYTLSGGSIVGLFIDGYNEMKLGDFNNLSNGNSIFFNNTSNLIYTKNLGNDIGLKLDFAIKSYSFGDFNYINNGANIQIDDANRFINITSSDNFNNTRLFLDDINQIIKTSNNGNDIGLKLDFANSNYLFGDNTNITGKSSYLELSSNAAQAAATIGIYGNVLTVREYGNIWGGAQGGMDFESAIYDNFEFNCNWNIKNDDIGQFPFYKNTIINTFGGVTTTEKAMNNNFFANNSQLSLNATVNLSQNEVLSNCFVFGLTDMVDVNNLEFFSKHAGTFNTNLAILNGSGLKIAKGNNHIFSVNASGLDFKDDNSGITILGGDVYDEGSGIYIIAHHVLSSGKCGINFTGQKAIGKNSFSNVFGYYNESYGTAIGQVQIEQKQLFADCPDGTAYYDLVDALQNSQIYVDNNTTYLVDVKVVSTDGSGNIGSSANWAIYRQYMICVDAFGSLSASDHTIHSFNFSPGQQDLKIFSNTNAFYFQVQPDNNNGAHCWVRAEIVLHKIQAI